MYDVKQTKVIGKFSSMTWLKYLRRLVEEKPLISLLRLLKTFAFRVRVSEENIFFSGFRASLLNKNKLCAPV
jgi:hypothetical protein